MNKGFTLVELLVVVLIVGVLSAIALPQYTTAVERSRSAEALSLMSSIAESAQRYYFQHDAWPHEDDWRVLDIDVPVISGSTNRGGKSFRVNMGACGDSSFCVVATRQNIGEGAYSLKTVLTDSDSDTVFSTRCCGAEGGADSSTCATPSDKALTYCNAITGGNNSDF